MNSTPVPLEVEFRAGALPEWTQPPWAADGRVGAYVEFAGLVRRSEDDRTLLHLGYEAYQPMAEQEMRRLAQDIVARHALLGLRVWHSVGPVGVGRASFRLGVAGAHRPKTLAAMDAFIARMKQEVPIFKVPVFA